MKKAISLWVLCILTAVGVSFGSDSADTPAADSFYAAGVTAAQRGDDADALHAFEAAQAAGLNTPRLQYNRGVVLYRMGRFGEAAAAFEQAAVDPELAALAHYNLGRMAQIGGQDADARRHYRQARRRAGDVPLRELALAAEATLPVVPPAHLVLLELALGYDSAAGFDDDVRALPNRTGDGFASLWLYGDHRLTGDAQRGLKLMGSGLVIGHLDEHDSNLLLVEAGPGWRHPLGVWRTESGLLLQHVHLGSATLENVAEFYTEARRLLDPDGSPRGARLHLRYRVGIVAGGDEYAYLDGTRQDFRARLGGALGHGRWLADYTLEVDDRENLQTGTTFMSASPVRHRFGVGYSRRFADAWDMRLDASWRQSRYGGGEDTLPDGTARRRQDERTMLSGQVTHRVPTRAWSPFLRLDWTDNASNIPAQEYDRLRTTLGAERAW